FKSDCAPWPQGLKQTNKQTNNPTDPRPEALDASFSSCTDQLRDFGLVPAWLSTKMKTVAWHGLVPFNQMKTEPCQT
ncbi:mCG1040094, partial [Mus musculus]